MALLLPPVLKILAFALRADLALIDDERLRGDTLRDFVGEAPSAFSSLLVLTLTSAVPTSKYPLSATPLSALVLYRLDVFKKSSDIGDANRSGLYRGMSPTGASTLHTAVDKYYARAWACFLFSTSKRHT